MKFGWFIFEFHHDFIVSNAVINRWEICFHKIIINENRLESSKRFNEHQKLFFRWYFVVDSDLREGDINAMTVAEYFEFCDEIFGDFIFKDS
jgi:hypothetical protein